MPMRGELPIQLLGNGTGVGSIRSIWKETTADDADPRTDLFAICVFSLIGIGVSIGFAVEFPILTDEAAWLLQLGG